MSGPKRQCDLDDHTYCHIDDCPVAWKKYDTAFSWSMSGGRMIKGLLAVAYATGMSCWDLPGPQGRMN